MDSSSPHHKSPQKETEPRVRDRVARSNRVRFCRGYLGHLPLETTWPLNHGYRKASDIGRDEGALADTLQNYEAMASSSMVVENQNTLVFVSNFCFCFVLTYLIAAFHCRNQQNGISQVIWTHVCKHL